MSRIVLDGLALQVRSAGIAIYTEGLVRAMAALQPETEFVLLGVRGLPRRVVSRGRKDDERSHPRRWPANVRFLDSHAYPLLLGTVFGPIPRLLSLESVVPDADLFHATNYVTPRTRSVPVVVTVHDLALVRFPQLGTRTLRRMISKTQRFLEAADLVVADSRSTRRDLIELLHVPAAKVRVVHLGCNPVYRPLPAEEARRLVRDRHGIRDPFLLHVGTLEPRKNLERLVSAYARLCRGAEIEQRLVLVGDRGWGYEGIFDLVASLGIESRVSFVGWIPNENLRAFYGAADLFVYPSLYEGFGLPVLEAMACGAPVVTSNAASLPEVAGDAALLVDPNDEEAIAGAIARALNDPALRTELRAKAVDRAASFSWERCGRETLAVYEEVRVL